MSEDVDNWNDDRLDELAKEVKAGSVRVEGHMREGFEKVDARFEKADARFEKVEGEMKKGFAAVAARFEETPTREEMNNGFAELRSAFAALNRTLIASAAGIAGTLIAGVVTLVVTHAG